MVELQAGVWTRKGWWQEHQNFASCALMPFVGPCSRLVCVRVTPTWLLFVARHSLPASWLLAAWESEPRRVPGQQGTLEDGPWGVASPRGPAVLRGWLCSPFPSFHAMPRPEEIKVCSIHVTWRVDRGGSRKRGGEQGKPGARLEATPLPAFRLKQRRRLWLQNGALEMPALVLLFCLLPELWLMALSLQVLLVGHAFAEPWVSVPCRTTGQSSSATTLHGAGGWGVPTTLPQTSRKQPLATARQVSLGGRHPPSGQPSGKGRLTRRSVRSSLSLPSHTHAVGFLGCGATWCRQTSSCVPCPPSASRQPPEVGPPAAGLPPAPSLPQWLGGQSRAANPKPARAWAHATGRGHVWGLSLSPGAP